MSEIPSNRKTPAEIVSRQMRNLLRLAAEIGKYYDREKVFSEKYELKDRPEIKKRSKSKYFAVRPRSDEITHRWNDLITDAWHTHHLLKKGVKAVDTILKYLPEIDQKVNLSKDIKFDKIKWAEFRGQVVRFKIKPSLLDFIGSELSKSKGDFSGLSEYPDIISMAQKIRLLEGAFADKIKNRMIPAHDFESRQRALGEILSSRNQQKSDTDVSFQESDYYTFRDSGGSGSSSGSSDSSSGSSVGSFLLFVYAVAVTIYGAVTTIAGWFNETDDDQAVIILNSKNCEDLKKMSDSDIIDLFKDMIDGPTGDDEEDAMLHVLNCFLGAKLCDRITNIVQGQFGTETFYNEFNGTQWDELMIVLYHCNLVNFTDFDDDATRLFIDKRGYKTADVKYVFGWYW
jgi:hypothetical protein